MSSALVILSGSYISAEMVAEFGLLPPAFLPFGHGRLFESQLRFTKQFRSQVFMTMPADFELEEGDKAIIASNEVTLLRSDSRQGLAEALVSVIQQIGGGGELRVLHGDTLVELEEEDLSKTDFLVEGYTSHYATWAVRRQDRDSQMVLRNELAGGSDCPVAAGYFAFSDRLLLKRCLVERGDFIAALNDYAAQTGFSSCLARRWLDFGHLNAYFQSRRSALLARQFNHIVPTSYGLSKSGDPPRKIYAELQWYRSVPKPLRPFLPQLFDWEQGAQPSYEVEYFYLPTLSELFLGGKVPVSTWRNIFASCSELLTVCQAERPLPGAIPFNFPRRFHEDVVKAKALARVEQFAQQEDFDLTMPWQINGTLIPSVETVIEQLFEAIPEPSAADICFWHGDLHFANMFYDTRAMRVRVVDPRGLLHDGTLSIYGDARYDVAKLAHSVLGLYDHLIASRYIVHESGRNILDLQIHASGHIRAIQDLFQTFSFGSISAGRKDVLAMTALLFLAMPPLHCEDRKRQLAMWATGLRLFSEVATK